MSSNLTEKQLTLPLSTDVLTGALTRREKAGFRFGAHIHTTIEFYRILSGFCYMDIGTETITCNTGDFIMILPNVVHSFEKTVTVNSSRFTSGRKPLPMSFWITAGSIPSA